MAFFDIPLSVGVPNYAQTTRLDGRTYFLSFRWNQRMQYQDGYEVIEIEGEGPEFIEVPIVKEGAWLFSIADQDEVPILSGRRLISGYPVLQRTASPGEGIGRPPGEILVIDTVTGNVDPGFLDLGERVILVYDSVGD